MSSYNRRLALILIAALAGCGFQPVYGPKGAARDLSGTIEIDPPRDTAGFNLVRQLEDRLGLPSSPTHRLAVDLRVTEEGRGITTDQITTRYNVRGVADYRLFDGQSAALVRSGSVANFTGYATTGTPVATQSAQRDARARLMTILADQIVADLLATAPDWRQ
ncbi:MAG: hypothetical protein HKN63_06410 [Rhodobacteraceae bacterium]|nr:hypothetical protein [Paracoccaceae bacterium]